MATCSDDGFTKYILGPVEIDGSEIADATSGYQPGPNGAPTSIVEVSLSFKDAGKAKFAEVTKRLYGMQGQTPKDQFAVVLDKQVITAPRAQAVITDGRASITGSFTDRLGQGARPAAEVRRAADLLRAPDPGRHHRPSSVTSSCASACSPERSACSSSSSTRSSSTAPSAWSPSPRSSWPAP